MASIDDWARCPLCMEPYDVVIRLPKSLPCRHTLCAPCVKERCQEHHQCPKCRVPVGDLNNLCNNLTMMDYLEQSVKPDYHEKQKRLREALKQVEKDLVNRKAMLENVANEYAANFDEIAERRQKMCKARLEEHVAKVQERLQKKEFVGKAILAIRMPDSDTMSTDAQMNQRDTVDEDSQDCDQEGGHAAEIRPLSPDESEAMYQSYIRAFTHELQTILSEMDVGAGGTQ